MRNRRRDALRLECDHKSTLQLARTCGSLAHWCTTCGALNIDDGWRIPAASPEDQRKLLGHMLGGALRTAFPGAAAKVDKFVVEATENSETIQWKPACEPPDTARAVIGILNGDDLVYVVLFVEGRFVEYDDDGVAHPIDVNWWTEMLTGPRPEENEPK